MTSPLISIGTILGLDEAGTLSALLALGFACMVTAVATLLWQSYRDQKPELQRIQRRARAKFLD